MESYQIEHLTFTYPNEKTPALDDISFDVAQGEFLTLCGKSGCGKSTLLRLLKPRLAPYGKRLGRIYFHGKPLEDSDDRTQSAAIGFVLQSPDNQIVTDKVWHELAFGLESLGCPTPEIRVRVAEMASFFGIQTWFHKNVCELSGGQKQLLNLAAVMVMQPSVLILDEPTAQLDPIAAADFLETVAKINREFGTTVLLSEHRLEEAFPLSDRVLVMDGGKIAALGTPTEVGGTLRRAGHDMCAALPAPIRIYAGVVSDSDTSASGLRDACPVTVREGRTWLENFAASHALKDPAAFRAETPAPSGMPALEFRDVWFRYEKNLPDVVKGLSLTIRRGELYAIVGGNGTGKTTTLSLMKGLLAPYRGEILVNGTRRDKHDLNVGVLPQNPQALFVKKTVEEDLYEMLSEHTLPTSEKAARVRSVARLCELEQLLMRHPYDLSGGEQQRAALAKVLLLAPEILLLDEPTKGFDAAFKQTFAWILSDLKASGVTVVMVSHDIEFCAEHTDRCGMFFDGTVVSEGEPRTFFSGKSFYTTAANRMARSVLPAAVLTEDVIAACGGTLPPPSARPVQQEPLAPAGSEPAPQKNDHASPPPKQDEKNSPAKRISGILFTALFLVTVFLPRGGLSGLREYLVQGLSIAAFAGSLACFFPRRKQKPLPVTEGSAGAPPRAKKLPPRTRITLITVLVAVPLTILFGVYFLGDRKYYFISLLILLETFLPFGMVFESRKPQARELVIIGVLCAIAVAGRAAFFMLPQFKPVAALVTVAGVAFGAETGFLVGAVTGFVSNFFFGQGPWTPWQMFAFGLIGLMAGVLFRKGLLRAGKIPLAVYGSLASLLLYGGILNASSVLMWQAKPNAAMFLAAYASGLPFDLVHAASTFFFLWFLAEPMLEKLTRVKEKYGLTARKEQLSDRVR